MTRAEIKAKSDNKMKALTVFCQQMQITITAEQVINERGIIKTTVFYNDTENYPLDAEEAVTKENDNNPIEETPSVREQNFEDSLRVRSGDVGSGQEAEHRADEGNIDQSRKHFNTGVEDQGAKENIS